MARERSWDKKYQELKVWLLKNNNIWPRKSDRFRSDESFRLPETYYSYINFIWIEGRPARPCGRGRGRGRGSTSTRESFYADISDSEKHDLLKVHDEELSLGNWVNQQQTHVSKLQTRIAQGKEVDSWLLEKIRMFRELPGWKYVLNGDEDVTQSSMYAISMRQFLLQMDSLVITSFEEVLQAEKIWEWVLTYRHFEKVMEGSSDIYKRWIIKYCDSTVIPAIYKLDEGDKTRRELLSNLSDAVGDSSGPDAGGGGGGVFFDDSDFWCKDRDLAQRDEGSIDSADRWLKKHADKCFSIMVI